jgi:hypothetical protein
VAKTSSNNNAANNNNNKRRKVRRNVTSGIAFIKSTFNNTQVTITDTRAGRAVELADSKEAERALRLLVRLLHSKLRKRLPSMASKSWKFESKVQDQVVRALSRPFKRLVSPSS